MHGLVPSLGFSVESTCDVSLRSSNVSKREICRYLHRVASTKSTPREQDEESNVARCIVERTGDGELWTTIFLFASVEMLWTLPRLAPR